MSRAAIRSRFDEIVAFSGVEKFIDMPVKRYSSGMYVRLAFAVAAHLDSELLLLDEVLAVGDAEFQIRCLDKMRSITSDEGRTIIFVSHNMMAVRALCNRAVVLKNGERISGDEDVGNCVNLYLRERQPGGERVLEWSRSSESFRHCCFSPSHLALTMEDGTSAPEELSTGGAYRVDFYFDVKRIHPGLYFDFLVSAGGVPLFSASPWENREKDFQVHSGENRISWFIPQNLLNVGNYRITLRASASGGGGFRMPAASAPELRVPVSVCDYPLARPALADRRLLHPELRWELE
jgi:lipopolysaccharide transport system ATP-binding protein